jgi:hypothetical protein
MHKEPSKTGALQTGIGSKTVGNFAAMSWVAFGLWALELMH